MEVRWYRKDFQTPALLYREKQLQGDPQDPQYKGRVSLDQRNPQSGGLKAGDVSLKLENVTLADEGEFVCYVRSDVHYDAGRSIHLYVTVIGSIPVLSAHQVDDVTVNVSCSSSGWHPQPSIIWSNSQGTSSITPGGLKYSDPDQGLVSVSSWILTSPSDSGRFSCSVSVPEGEKRESWVAVLTASSKSTKSSNQSGQWKAAFIAILCLVLAASVIAALLFIKKRRDKKPSEENPKEHDPSKKRPTIITDMDQLKKGEVDVILDEDTAHLSLKIGGNGKIVRDSLEPTERQPTEKTFTSLPFVQGKEGFTSGCAYWERAQPSSMRYRNNNNRFETFSVVVPQRPISARLGSRVTLPCWLSPDISAEAMEVRWYRKDFQTPALLYREKQLQGDPQDPQYKGRVSLDQRNPQSGGLKAGDVSLKLENVTLEDEGEFVCYVSSDLHYDPGRSVHLNVIEVGSIPVLSALQVDDVTVNVSCSSSGWNPQPSLVWSDSQGTSSITPSGLKYSDPDQGLVSVSSWILTSPSDSDWISCSVSVPEGEKREGRVAALTALPKSTDQSETEPLLPTDPSKKRPTIITDMDQLKKGEVDVILDEDTAHLNLKIRGNGKIVRDSPDPPERQPTEKTFTSLPFVQGKEGFTSGCAYWEVGLANPSTGLKNVWSVGLVSESATRDCGALSTDNGFWVLTLDGDNGLYVNIKPEISICKHLRIQTLGVYLDYDGNMISFYNVEEKSHLITLFTKFSGKVYPLFSPGKGDRAPLRILSIPCETPATSQGVDQSSNNHHQPQPNTEQSQTQPDAVSYPPTTTDQALSHTPQPETSNDTHHS
ncbi:hypothetical protein JZ751_005907 [Albula glossodonta]|uniref:Uncharacterized protein n=1 Tax=Albula glossodonta TaxID=121402 RepID=A0A8T2P588_9TELE|nr:hypothetical protein JZ751_005907 [Albula glossodonta]